MAFSGKITAANHADLLAKVTNFITGDPGTPGRDWTVARQDSLAWGRRRSSAIPGCPVRKRYTWGFAPPRIPTA